MIRLYRLFILPFLDKDLRVISRRERRVRRTLSGFQPGI